MVLSYFPRLKERLKQQAGTLSGGEQQMLAISRALMLRPRLMLLDEPSFGLAPLIVQEIFRIMRLINSTSKVSMLLVEQNAALALDLAEQAYVLETGRDRHVGAGGADQERRGDPAILSWILKHGLRGISRVCCRLWRSGKGPHGTVRSAVRIRTRKWRHLRLRGLGAGDDFRVDRPPQFRPGRDGDVLDLSHLAADAMGIEFLGRAAGLGDAVVLHRRVDRTHHSAAAA